MLTKDEHVRCDVTPHELIRAKEVGWLSKGVMDFCFRQSQIQPLYLLPRSIDDLHDSLLCFGFTKQDFERDLGHSPKSQNSDSGQYISCSMHDALM